MHVITLSKHGGPESGHSQKNEGCKKWRKVWVNRAKLKFLPDVPYDSKFSSARRIWDPIAGCKVMSP